MPAAFAQLHLRSRRLRGGPGSRLAHALMVHGSKQRQAGSHHLVTVPGVEAHGGIACVQHDGFGATRPGSTLELTQDGAADALTALRLVDRHEPNLRLARRIEMKTPGADSVAGRIEHEQMSARMVEFVPFAAARLSPWSAEHTPAQIIIERPLGFRAWLGQVHDSREHDATQGFLEQAERARGEIV